MEQFIEQFVELANTSKLTVIVSLITANLVLGIATSLYTKMFRLKKVGDFLLTKVLPYILGYFVVVIVAIANPTFQIAIPIVWGIIVASLSGAILANFKHVGFNLPDVLSDTED